MFTRNLRMLQENESVPLPLELAAYCNLLDSFGGLNVATYCNLAISFCRLKMRGG